MNDSEQSPIHQLLLGLRHGEGVSVLAHSMTTESLASSWQNKLERHVRLLPWETEPALPAKALSYYQFDGYAAVLRRWPSGGSLGRSNAHALIGPIEVLTVPVALGLDSGLNWQRAADNARSPLPGRWLNLSQNTVTELRNRTAGQPEMLRRVLGKLIDAQTKPLTILGCPDADRVALTWALVHIGSAYLAKTSHIIRSWTFSTYEIEDADSISNLPEILFMPGRPTGREVASRDTVDVSCNQPLSAEAEEWSNLLVERFISREPLMPGFDHLSTMPVTGAALISTGQHERQEQECPPEQSVPAPRSNQASTSRYAEDRQQAPQNSLRSQVSPAPKISSERLKKELKDLICAEDRNLFELRLKGLGCTPGERAEIRKILRVENYLEMIIEGAKWYPAVEDKVALFRRLRVAIFGPDGRDLSDPDVVVFAIQLIKHPDAPDLFVYGLAEEMKTKGQSNDVDPVLAARWLEQHDPVRELADVSRGRWGIYRQRRTARIGRSDAAVSLLGRRSWPLAAVGIALLAAILFVVFIYSETPKAGSSGEEKPTTQSTTSSTAGSQQGKEAVRPVEVSGEAAKNDLVIRGPWRVAGDKSEVFLLLRPVSEASTYYSQGACKVVEAEQAWVCEKLPLSGLATVRSPFEVLVIRVSPQSERYQNFVNKKPFQSSPSDPMDVIFKDSRRS